MKIQMTDPKGITLLTAGKKLDENIEVVPGFAAVETVEITITDNTSGLGGAWYYLTANGLESCFPDSEAVKKDVLKGSLMLHSRNSNITISGADEHMVLLLTTTGEINISNIVNGDSSSTDIFEVIIAAEDMTITTTYGD